MIYFRILIVLSFISIYSCTSIQPSSNTDKVITTTVDTISSETFDIISYDTTEPSAVGKQGIGLFLSQDSGFILKKDGLHFLLSVSLTDTSDSYWSQAINNDTIGKYYKVVNTGNFLVCLIDLTKRYSFETHLLLEIDKNGTVVKNERFYHSNYSCCWNNYYGGFYKKGDYFLITTCGTGSGYCGSFIYPFKQTIPQDEQNSIVKSYWSSFSSDGLSERLSSDIDFYEDYLILHYKLEKGKLNGKLTKFKVKKTERFDVKYIFQNGTWLATDSTKLKELNY